MENFTELLNRYNAGDSEAGTEVDRLVKERIERTGETYSLALYALSREARQYSTSEILGRRKDDIPRRYAAGVELDRRAKEIVESEGVGYTVALKRAMLERPDDAEAHTGMPVRRDFAARIPRNELTNICSGHKMDDGSVNWTMAVGAAKTRPDVVQAAAQARIEELVNQLISNEGTPGSVVNDPNGDYRGDVRRRIRTRYSDLANVADNGRSITEEGLREIL